MTENTSVPGGSVDASVRIDELFGLALRHHQAGQLSEAEKLYKKILAVDPNHIKSLHFLGVIAHQVGRSDIAIKLIGKAIALNNQIPMFHNNIGEAYRALGRLEDAVVHYTKAITLEPESPEAHFGLGVTMKQQGKVDEAVTQYRRALAIKPEYVEAHVNLGNIFAIQGKQDEAVAQFQCALALKPSLIEAHNNLGNALMEKGDLTQALKAIQRSIEIGESEYAKTLFVQCVKSLSFIPDGLDLRENLIRALSEPWGRPIDLAKFGAGLLKRSSATSACINRAAGAWPRRLSSQELFGPTGLAEVCDDQLLRSLLESAPVCQGELERFLTATRLTMLDAASADVNSRQVEEHALPFFCALAQQCFINEYVFAHADHEIVQARRLRESLIGAVVSETSIPELWLVAVAAYFPLPSLPVTELILARTWSTPVAALVVRQVREWQEERQSQASVARLTTIEHGVSLLVKQQYEESPYPRWMKAAPVGKSTTIDRYLRRQFPLVSIHNLGKESGLEVLVAGCGTGQDSIEAAQRFTGAQVLAVDLSLTSLCYAKRKTRELGLNNIEYAQADILQLESIGRTFDVIEASGVLHHLADPFMGWRVLLSVLRSSGFMRLGLYSKLGRQHLAAARAFITQRGYRATSEDIRRCRQELATVDDSTSLKDATESSDFFSTSTCRDLLFHVQEHQLTLPEISSFLTESRLEFCGFDVPGLVLQNFRRRFPDAKVMTDLNLWHVFETENPATFAGMYQFWIQKTW